MEEIIELHEALDRLAALDARKAEVVELKYFGGLNYDEIAEVLRISAITVRRDWELAPDLALFGIAFRRIIPLIASASRKPDEYQARRASKRSRRFSTLRWIATRSMSPGFSRRPVPVTSHCAPRSRPCSPRISG